MAKRTDFTKLTGGKRPVLGGKDRSRSVGDFLLEIDETLRPLEDLTGYLDAHPPHMEGFPYSVPYNEEEIALRGQRRLRLLLQDGKDIAVARRGDHTGLHWGLSIPTELVPTIREKVDALIEKREHIAQLRASGARQEASDERLRLRLELSQLGLLVADPKEFVPHGFMYEIDQVCIPLARIFQIFEDHARGGNKSGDRLLNAGMHTDMRFTHLSKAQDMQRNLQLVLYPEGDDIKLVRSALHATPEFIVRVPKQRIPQIIEKIGAILDKAGDTHKAADKPDPVLASTLRQDLWEELSYRGLAVQVPDNELQLLVSQYLQLPDLEALGGYKEQMEALPDKLQAMINSSAGNKGSFEDSSLAERALTATLRSIAEEVYRKRHEIGRSANESDSTHYFPHDVVALVTEGINRGLANNPPAKNQPSIGNAHIAAGNGNITVKIGGLGLTNSDVPGRKS